MPLAEAQRTFAAAGQMLALDPPLSVSHSFPSGATIGGIAATGDSGPLRHRYGAPRDLIVGATVALSDGSVARSGGKVIKNVAGYDLAKLFAGSFGTLGMILSVSVRLHPLPLQTTTVLSAADDPDLLGAAALTLSSSQLEFEALDVAWRGGRGGVLARCAGPEHARRARRAGQALIGVGLAQVEITADAEALWERQRAGQRSDERAAGPHRRAAKCAPGRAAGGRLGRRHARRARRARNQLRRTRPAGGDAAPLVARRSRRARLCSTPPQGCAPNSIRGGRSRHRRSN